MPRGWIGDGAGHIATITKELRAAVYIGNGLLMAKCVPPKPRRRTTSSCVVEQPGVAMVNGMGGAAVEPHQQWQEARHNRPSSYDGERPGVAGLDAGRSGGEPNALATPGW